MPLQAILPRDFDRRIEWVRAREVSAIGERALAAHRSGRFLAIDPVPEPSPSRVVVPGRSGPADAVAALAALDLAADFALHREVDAIITCPVSKESIARHVARDFRGHTEYFAARCGLEVYGRDYLMTFLTPDLTVALLSTHLPLRAALDRVSAEAIHQALRCLNTHLGRAAGRPGRLAVAAFNPHAGEGGLLGSEDDEVVRPGVEAARAEGIDAVGPFAADSLFARARQGEFAAVLALYHDQGLIAVKTSAFGHATNWTLGLPILRTSVDHGTAFEIAGRGVADPEPLREVIRRTVSFLQS